jgi:hypothetical protein
MVFRRVVEVVREFDPFVVEPGDRGWYRSSSLSLGRNSHHECSLPGPRTLFSPRVPGAVVPLYNPVSPDWFAEGGFLRFVEGRSALSLTKYAEQRRKRFNKAVEEHRLLLRRGVPQAKIDDSVLEVIVVVPGLLVEQYFRCFAEPYETEHAEFLRSVDRNVRAGRVRIAVVDREEMFDEARRAWPA